MHCLAIKYGQRPSAILRGRMSDYVIDVRVLEAGTEAESRAREGAETQAKHNAARRGR